MGLVFDLGRNLEQRRVVPVPDVDLAVLGAAHDEGLVAAAEDRTDHEAALRRSNR